MTTIKEAVKAVLTGDATLMALATGGVHDGDTLGRRGLTREDLAVAGKVAINPGIKITWSTQNPFGVAQKVLGAERIFFYVYFYQDTGYSTIVAMRQRVRTLLEWKPDDALQHDEPANDWMNDILWRGDLTDMKDNEMGGVSMECSRYEVLVTPVVGGS